MDTSKERKTEGDIQMVGVLVSYALSVCVLAVFYEC